VPAYGKKFRDQLKNPRNVGSIKNPSGVGYVGDPSRGIAMELYISVKDGVIEDAKFKTLGCAASIAASSMVAELVRGKSVEDALKISDQAVAEALGGLPLSQFYCASMGQELIKSAVDDYMDKIKRGERKV
jgi:nitrogen fixation NifU-like protein